MRTSLEARFWAKVTVPLSPAGCWLWNAGTIRGYGQLSVGSGKREYAHRFAYQMLVGPIPAGLTVDHLCRTENCVNPLHMELVSAGENALRGNNPFAMRARQTQCIHGHRFTPANTRLRRLADGKTQRQCRACSREAWHRRKEAA